MEKEEIKLLLCEDDENLGLLLREYLEDKGFRGSVMGAVFAAFCRGKEIGKQD